LMHIVGVMVQDVKDGSALHTVFAKHSSVFSPLYCSMVHAGETSGALPQILERLLYIIGHEHKIKSDIKSAVVNDNYSLTCRQLEFNITFRGF